MARATPGDDEKKTQTEVCATFSQELFMARATPGDDEKKTQTEVYATFSEELFMERRFHPEMMKNKYGFTD